MSFPAEFPARPVFRGDSVSWPFTSWVDRVGGTPRDLSGWSDWLCQWRPYADSTDVIDLAVDVSLLSVGKFTVSVTSEQSLEMGRSGVIDVQSVRGSETRTWVNFVTDYQKDVARNV
jgi:hypothetical protein